MMRLRSLFRFANVARLVLLVSVASLTLWYGLQRPALHQAEAAFERKEIRNALRLALDDLDGHPRSRVASLIAARSFSQIGYGAEAEPYYEDSDSRAALAPAVLNDRIQGLIVSNQLDRVVSLCREVLANRPDEPMVLRHLAFVYWLRGQYDEAQAVAESLANTNEGRVEGIGLLAMIHHEAKHPSQAIVAFETLLEIDPDIKTYRPGPAIFWRDFTDDLVQVHRNAEASKYLDKATRIYHDPGLLDILAWARKELGDADGAERAWRASLQQDPSRLNPQLQLGRLFVSRARFAEAIGFLERVIAADPSNQEGHYLLSRAYLFLGRELDSQRHFQRSEEIGRASPDPPGGMGPAK